MKKFILSLFVILAFLLNSCSSKIEGVKISDADLATLRKYQSIEYAQLGLDAQKEVAGIGIKYLKDNLLLLMRAMFMSSIVDATDNVDECKAKEEEMLEDIKKLEKEAADKISMQNAVSIFHQVKLDEFADCSNEFVGFIEVTLNELSCYSSEQDVKIMDDKILKIFGNDKNKLSNCHYLIGKILNNISKL